MMMKKPQQFFEDKSVGIIVYLNILSHKKNCTSNALMKYLCGFTLNFIIISVNKLVKHHTICNKHTLLITINI